VDVIASSQAWEQLTVVAGFVNGDGKGFESARTILPTRFRCDQHGSRRICDGLLAKRGSSPESVVAADVNGEGGCGFLIRASYVNYTLSMLTNVPKTFFFWRNQVVNATVFTRQFTEQWRGLDHDCDGEKHAKRT